MTFYGKNTVASGKRCFFVQKYGNVSVCFSPMPAENPLSLEAFRTLTGQPQPPALPPLLLALWHEARGNWEAAHAIAQQREGTPAYDHLHAYLHRREGDAFNAAYWYRRAGQAVPVVSLQEEWNQLARRWLSQTHA